MKCTFCGYEFDARAAHLACERCHCAHDCAFVKCPNCQYELVPDKSGLTQIKTGTVEEEIPLEGDVPITQMTVNQTAVVSRLVTRDKGVLRKFIAMGILPGISLKVLQTFPTYVLAIDHDRFAIDRSLASCVYVGTVYLP